MGKMEGGEGRLGRGILWVVVVVEASRVVVVCGSGEAGELAGLAYDGGGRRKARSGPFGILFLFWMLENREGADSIVRRGKAEPLLFIWVEQYS